MAYDYPDFMQNVSRAPIQSLPYQIWAVTSNLGDAIAASTSEDYIFELPDNGYRYVIDTVFLSWTILGPTYVGLNMCEDQDSPVWVALAAGRFEYCTRFVISNQGAFTLMYPQALKITITNDNMFARAWSAYINHYRYTE